MNSWRDKRRYLLLPVFSVLLVCACTSCCLVTRQVRTSAGVDRMTIEHDELERSFYLYVPPSYDGTQPVPLMLVLHGGGGSAGGIRKLTQGFDDLAEREGFMIAYPGGVDGHWNDGRESSANTSTDDVGFLSSLIDRLSEEYVIDSQRVYATGISNGGFMSFRLACELAEKIAAVAPVTASLTESLYATCSPARSVSILILNGTDDPLLPWEGGEIGTGRQMIGTVLSAEDTVAFWVAHNKCAATPTITQMSDTDPGDGTQVRVEAYESCEGGTSVVLYAVEGGGHTWPGGWQYLPESVIGKTSREFDANEVIWRFFEERAKK